MKTASAKGSDSFRLGEGFDTIAWTTYIGRRAEGNYFNGTISHFLVFKGILNDAEIKTIYNNGLLSNPPTELLDKYELVLLIDFNNPFDDVGTLKFPDLSPSNHTVIAHNWADLPTLQGSLVDKNSLIWSY